MRAERPIELVGHALAEPAGSPGLAGAVAPLPGKALAIGTHGQLDFAGICRRLAGRRLIPRAAQHATADSAADLALVPIVVAADGITALGQAHRPELGFPGA